MGRGLLPAWMACRFAQQPRLLKRLPLQQAPHPHPYSSSSSSVRWTEMFHAHEEHAWVHSSSCAQAVPTVLQLLWRFSLAARYVPAVAAVAPGLGVRHCLVTHMALQEGARRCCSRGGVHSRLGQRRRCCSLVGLSVNPGSLAAVPACMQPRDDHGVRRRSVFNRAATSSCRVFVHLGAGLPFGLNNGVVQLVHAQQQQQQRTTRRVQQQ
jgi:hypothetical protein